MGIVERERDRDRETAGQKCLRITCGSWQCRKRTNVKNSCPKSRESPEYGAREEARFEAESVRSDTSDQIDRLSSRLTRKSKCYEQRGVWF